MRGGRAIGGADAFETLYAVELVLNFVKQLVPLRMDITKSRTYLPDCQ